MEELLRKFSFESMLSLPELKYLGGLTEIAFLFSAENNI